MSSYVMLSGKLIDERSDAVRMVVPGGWDFWLPRSTINPKGGLRIKRATNDVWADVARWKVEQLVKDGSLPTSVLAAYAVPDDAPSDLEASDERFKRKGQEKI